MNTPLMQFHIVPTLQDMTPILTPSSFPQGLSTPAAGHHPVFPVDYSPYQSTDVENTLITPEVRSMPEAHEIPYSLEAFATICPSDTTDVTIQTTPMDYEVQVSNQTFHQDYDYNQPASVFPDLEETMLHELMQSNTGIASGISAEILTSFNCPLRPSLRKTQHLEEFISENHSTEMALHTANGITCDEQQSKTSFFDSSMPMEQIPTEIYRSDYSTLLGQDPFAFTAHSLPFCSDQISSSSPSPAISSSFVTTFHPLFNPAFSVNSSCYPSPVSTCDILTESNNISSEDCSKITPAMHYILQSGSYKGDYDSEVEDISFYQRQDNTYVPHSRYSSVERSSDTSSDNETHTDRHLNDELEEDDTTGGSSRTFLCHYPNCNRTFGRSYNLKAHALTHGTFRPFPCHLCQRTFARTHDRDRHMSSHRAEKAHSCIVCLNRFARQDAVIRHLKLSSEMNPCSWILKSRGITFRDVAAGRVSRRALGTEEEINKLVETLENEIRKMRAARALERMKVPKAQGM
ncbi:hypothetical protein FBU30_010416 [Linnemannia zychae]|nr:hypothetical protein FBU30_010416 [Linnemannia zychae]